MNATGQSFNSRQSYNRKFKISAGPQGPVGRSMGRVSGEHWTKVADPKHLNNLITSQIDYDTANIALNKSKSGANFNQGKLKIRTSQNTMNAESMNEKKDEKERPIHMSQGPVNTNKKPVLGNKPVVGGMVSVQMMQDQHSKAKKQIGFKKKTNYI